MTFADPLLPAEKRQLTRLAGDLVRWAGTDGRHFPWRLPAATTYEKIAVEVLLQRTTANAVGRFYAEFFARFPSWEALADARPEELETFLKPLGLWRRRAVSLLGLARYAAKTNGLFPTDPRLHRDIPAVGQYVSNAILSFQHQQRTPLLDVNMARVIERFLRPRRLADIRYDPWLQAASHWFVRRGDVQSANWAVLDFAAIICKARTPLCTSCPVNTRCAYFASL
ncbi:hypothetical protein [Sphingomonas aurantiaca]|nr:hypothetical protein [Sphingomonas aurantiaca]